MQVCSVVPGPGRCKQAASPCVVCIPEAGERSRELRGPAFDYRAIDRQRVMDVTASAAPNPLLRDAVERWSAFIEGARQPRGPWTPLQADTVSGLWRVIARRVASLLPPAAGQGDEGVLLTWDTRDDHVEVEVLADGSFEWFVRDRRDGTDEAGEGSRGAVLPDVLLRRLERMGALANR